jgi:hypothetical protein
VTMHWWRAGGRNIVSAVVSAGIGWFAFVADRPVPILDWFDLGVHEAGHMIGFALPELLMFMAGSFAQIAFPVAMAAYFLGVRRDPASGGFCLAWAGTSAWDVSVYVADAPVQALPLIGGGQHDWAFIFGHFGAIDQADRVAGFIETCGAVMVLIGMAVALAPLARRRGDAEPVRRTGLPVREVRDHEAPSPVPGSFPGPGPPGFASSEPTSSPPALPQPPGHWGAPELLPEDPFSEARPTGRRVP